MKVWIYCGYKVLYFAGEELPYWVFNANSIKVHTARTKEEAYKFIEGRTS